MRAASTHNRSRPRARSLTLSAGTVLLLLAGLSVSCGGTDRSAAPSAGTDGAQVTVAAEQWRRTTEEGCSQVSEQYEDLALAEPADRSGAVAHLERVRSFAEDLVEAQPGTLPQGAAVLGMELVDEMSDLADLSSKLASAAERGDADDVSELSAKLTRIGDRINEHAIQLGVESCGGL